MYQLQSEMIQYSRNSVNTIHEQILVFYSYVRRHIAIYTFSVVRTNVFVNEIASVAVKSRQCFERCRMMALAVS